MIRSILTYLALLSCNTKEPIKKLCADKEYCAPWNRLDLITELFCNLDAYMQKVNCPKFL